MNHQKIDRLPELVLFFERRTRGRLDRARVASLVGEVISGPESVRVIRERDALIGAAILVDTCHNGANAAELLLVLEGGSRKTFDELLAWGEERARGGVRVALDIPFVDESSANFSGWLDGRGYSLAYELHQMKQESGAPIVSGYEPPRGFAWKGPEEKFLPSYYEAVRLAFAEIPGAMIPSFDAFAERARKITPPARLLVDDKRVAAFVRVELRSSGVGEVVILGRHPDFRGRGLGEVLLAEGLRLLGEEKVTHVELEVAAANRKALALYERAGFRRIETTPVHRLPLKEAK